MRNIEKLFDKETMSVHIKEGSKIFAKKGQPGKITFEEISEVVSEKEINDYVSEIEATANQIGYFDQKSDKIQILQVEHFRIVITFFPLSEKTEITIVKPVKSLSLEDYNLDEKLKERILGEAEGILIAGAPGSGKSTFTTALINFFYEKKKIIKTLESPRDLQVPTDVTQFSMKHSSYDSLRDILLLSRPDNVFFDEIRNLDDFKFFFDLRLSGIGMVGIVHATKAIDAIQRFVGKIELGMIPSVIDTVIFIKNGKVEKILTLNYEIKTPFGMEERDLKRPVISVVDFATGEEEFELYTFGEETIVMEITEQVEPKKTFLDKIAEENLQNYFNEKGFITKVSMKSSKRAVVKISGKEKGRFIGTGGETVRKFENELEISLDIEEDDEMEFTKKKNKFKKKRF